MAAADAALDAVEKAKTSDDPEVRARAEQIVKKTEDNAVAALERLGAEVGRDADGHITGVSYREGGKGKLIVDIGSK